LKKGCFVKIIIVLTILVAAVLYIAQNYMDELIINPGKRIIKNVATNEFNKKLENVKQTPEKDSLIILFNDFIEKKFEKIKKININNGNYKEEDIDNFFGSINKYLRDSIISETDLLKIKNIMEEDLE
jgi:hypothetical protein